MLKNLIIMFSKRYSKNDSILPNIIPVSADYAQ